MNCVILVNLMTDGVSLTQHARACSDTRPDRKLSRELLDYGLLGEGVVDTTKVQQ